jgi:hypothetical protein
MKAALVVFGVFVALLLVGSASADKSARIEIGPTPYDYGAVVPGSNATETFTVDNLSHGRTAALAASIDGNAFSIVDDGCSGTRLGAFDSCAITVAFTPTTTGTETASLSVDAGHDGVATADLSGTGVVRLSMSIQPNDAFDANGVPHVLPGHYLLDDPTNYQSSGHFVPDYSTVTVTAGGPLPGDVSLSSSCPVSYTQSTAGSFEVALGDNVAFGADRGVAPTSFAAAGVDCTLTATAADALPVTIDVRVAGEWCDNVDNNRNTVVDNDGFPSRGKSVTAVNMSGEWVCTPDGLGLASSVSPDYTKPPFVG